MMEDGQASLWQNGGQTSAVGEEAGLNMGAAPPGYTSNTNLDKNKATADSVLDFKRDLAEQLSRGRGEDSGNTSSTTSKISSIGMSSNCPEENISSKKSFSIV